MLQKSKQSKTNVNRFNRMEKKQKMGKTLKLAQYTAHVARPKFTLSLLPHCSCPAVAMPSTCSMNRPGPPCPLDDNGLLLDDKDPPLTPVDTRVIHFPHCLARLRLPPPDRRSHGHGLVNPRGHLAPQPQPTCPGAPPSSSPSSRGRS